MYTRLNLIDKGQPSQAIALDPQHLVNLYPVTSFNETSAKSPAALYKTMGTKLFTTLPNQGTVRNILEFRNELYVVCDNFFYVVGPSGNAVNLGSLATYSGYVSMINNGSQLLLDDGLHGYTYTFATYVFAQVTDPNYVPSGYVTAQASRAIFMVPNSNVFFISNLADYTTWNALNFATAESIPQRGVAAFATPIDLFLFGEKNTEVWALTSDSLFPYAPRTGVNIPYGCAARRTIVYVNGTLLWLSKNDQGQAMLMSLANYSPQLQLDEAAQYQLSQISTISDAYAFSFQQAGHVFYALVFPTANKSFLYDIATQTLIDWSSWSITDYTEAGTPNYTNGRHLSSCYAFFDGMHVIGDYRGGGNLLILDSNTYTDYNCGPDNSIYVEWRTSITHKNKYRVYLSSVELDMETGVSPIHNSNETTNDPELILALSKNGGRSYDYKRRVNIGFTGEFKKRPRKRNWGTFRDGSFKIYGNHSCFIAIFGIIADLDDEGEYPLADNRVVL